MKGNVKNIFIFSLIFGVVSALIYTLKFIPFALPIFPFASYSWSLLLTVIVFDVAFLFKSRGSAPKAPVKFFIMLVFNLLLSLSVFIGNNTDFMFFVYTGLLLTISYQSLLYSSDKKITVYNFVVELCYDLFVRPFAGIGRYFKDDKQMRMMSANSMEKPNNKKHLLSVIVAVIVGVPFTLIATAILSATDPTFADLISQVNLIQIVGGTIIGLVFFCVLFSYLYSHYSFRPTKSSTWTTGNTKLRLPYVFSATFLFIINIVYTIFSVVQISHIFTGELPLTSTLSSYTSNGFVLLIALTIVNIIVLGLSMIFSEKRDGKNPLVLKIISGVLIINNVIMGISAYIRLSNYEDAFGFTKTRFYGYVLLALIAILLIYALIKLLVDRFPMQRATFYTLLIILLCTMFFDVDGFITDQNVQKYLDNSSKKVDIYYLQTIGYGSVPGLVELKGKTEDPKLEAQIDRALKNIKNNDFTKINRYDHDDYGYDYDEYYDEYYLGGGYYSIKTYKTLKQMRIEKILEENT